MRKQLGQTYPSLAEPLMLLINGLKTYNQVFPSASNYEIYNTSHEIDLAVFLLRYRPRYDSMILQLIIGRVP